MKMKGFLLAVLAVVLLVVVSPASAQMGKEAGAKSAVGRKDPSLPSKGFVFDGPIGIAVDYHIDNVDVGAGSDRLWAVHNQVFSRAATQYGLSVVMPPSYDQNREWLDISRSGNDESARRLKSRYVIAIEVFISPDDSRVQEEVSTEGSNIRNRSEERGIQVRGIGAIIDPVSHVIVGWLGSGNGARLGTKKPTYVRREEDVADNYVDFVRRSAGERVYIPSRAFRRSSEREESAQLLLQVEEAMSKVAERLFSDAGTISQEALEDIARSQPFRAERVYFADPGATHKKVVIIGAGGLVKVDDCLMLPGKGGDGVATLWEVRVLSVKQDATGRMTVTALSTVPLPKEGFELGEPLLRK